MLKLNLTDIPDAEAKKILLGARKEIYNYYNFTRPWLLIVAVINRIKYSNLWKNIRIGVDTFRHGLQTNK